ncbi:hypothetical protein Pelo_16850 [Pelomyxa schiedti]|nr:hypothetical protein Pelo_16850 [Pelomyxa schiedti]
MTWPVVTTSTSTVFLALAMSSHPRCGRMCPLTSALRCWSSSHNSVPSTPPGVCYGGTCTDPSFVPKLVWEAACGSPSVGRKSTTVDLVVQLQPEKFGLATFGVSPLTLGVTEDVSELTTWGIQWWPGDQNTPLLSRGAHFMMKRSLTTGGYGGEQRNSAFRFALCDAATGAECTELLDCGIRGAWNCMNEKWWVCQGAKNAVVVVNLWDKTRHVCGWPDSMSRELRDVQSCFFSTTALDDMVLIGSARVKRSNAFCFATVNIGQAFRVLNPESATKCVMEPGFELKTGLVLHRSQTGQRVFVVAIHPKDHAENCSINIIEESSAPQELHKLPVRNATLSQLNGSVFCIGKVSQYELWDCHNTSQPMRVIPHKTAWTSVTAESGLLFHTCANQIRVTDSTGTITILTINFSSRGQKVTLLNAMSSGTE